MPSSVRLTAWTAVLALLLATFTVAAGTPLASAATPAGAAAPSPAAASPGSAPGQPAPEQTETVLTAADEAEQARRTGERVEVPHLRTATSNTYVLPEGQMQSDIALRPVNYRDASGAWQPVDARLVPSQGGGWHAAAVGFTAELPASLATGPVRIADGGTWIEMRLDGAAAATGVVAGNAVTYPAVFPGVDVTFSVSGAGLKKIITLADRSARSDFDFDVTTSTDTTVTAGRSGVTVTRADSPGFVIPLPWAVDQAGDLSAGAGSPNAQLTTTKAGRSHHLRLGVDPAWLADPRRVFPVLLDPTVHRHNADLKDCFIYEPQADGVNYCGYEWLDIGGDNGIKRRSLFQFHVEGTIPGGSIVTDGRLQAKTRTAEHGTNEGTVSLHRVTSSWDSGTSTTAGTVAWKCRDQRTGCIPWTAGGEFDPVAASTTQVSAVSGTQPVWTGLAPLFQQWVNDHSTNRGMLLKVASEPSTTVYKLASAESGGAAPTASITWVPRTGEQSFETFYRDRLNDRTDIAVNVANGNLIVRASDLQVAGTGQDFAVGRTYNSLSAKNGGFPPVQGNGSFSAGWSSGTLLDTALNVVEGDHAEFYGPDGRVVTFRWNGTAWVSPAAANATLGYDSGSGRYRLTMHDSNLRYFFSYAHDNAWMLSSVVDRNGNTIRHDFAGGDGRIGAAGSLVDTQNRRFTLGYITADNGAKRLGSITDPTGRKQTYGYTDGRLTSVHNGDSSVAATRYAYYSGGSSSDGMLFSITDPSGRRTKFTYDSMGRATNVHRVTDASTSSGYNTSFAYLFSTSTITNIKSTVTDANGKKTTYQMDLERRVVKVTDALGHSRTRTYTPNSGIESYTGAATGTVLQGFTANNGESLTSQTISTGAASDIRYENPADSAGRQYQPSSTRTVRQTANNTSTALSYDAAGNLAQSMLATEGSKSAHNPNGTLKAVTTPENAGTTSGRTECASSDPLASGASTTSDNCSAISYVYDSAGVLQSTTTTPPVGAKWLRAATTFFDPLGRVRSSRDGRGITTSYSYDGLDRLKKVTYSDGTPGVSYSYDGAGNTLDTTDVSGTTTVDYDAVNRPIQRSIPERGTLTYAYDAVGNMTSSTQPAVVLAGVTVAGGATTYGYDAANNLTSLAEPGGSCTTDPQLLCTTFAYDNDDRRTKTTYPGTVGVVLTTGYDKAGRVKTVRAMKGAEALVSLDYCYAVNSPGGCSTVEADDMDLLQWRHDNLAASRVEYQYDVSDRLEVASNGSTAYGYGYDKNGNRTSETTSGSTSYSYEHDVADALCSRRSGTGAVANCTDTSNTSTTTIYRHDGAGNMIANGGTTAAYNGANQTTRYGTPTFSYAGTGQEDRLTAGGTSFTNGLLGTQRETSSDGLSTDFVKTPDGQLVSMSLPDTSRHYYLFDAQGSVLGLVDSNGQRTATYTYDPYGAHHTATGTAAAANRFRYISGYLDTTGLYKLGIRYYNPALGRFTQLDPTGQDPHYTYGRNSPVNASDPTGAVSALNIANVAIEVVLAFIPGFIVAKITFSIAKNVAFSLVDDNKCNEEQIAAGIVFGLAGALPGAKLAKLGAKKDAIFADITTALIGEFVSENAGC